MAKKVNTAAKHVDFVLIDIVSLVISFLAAYFIRIDRADDAEYYDLYRDMGIIILVIYLIVVAFSNAHSNILKRSALREAWQVGILNFEIISVVFALLFISKSTIVYSRMLFAIFIVLDCAVMFILRTLWKLMLLTQFRNGKNTAKVLVVTYEKNAENIIESLKSHNTGYYEYKGIVLEGESTSTEVCRIPVVKMEGILDYIKENAINEVFIFLKHGESGKLMSKFMIMGLTVHIGLDLELRNLSNVTIDNLAEYTIVTSTISRATVGELFIKRAFDILVGIIGLIVTAITFVFVAPIIKIQSPGPVFFVQKRVGKNGRIFNMIKFRSMYLDAEYRKSALMDRNEMSGPMFKVNDDPRCFPFGRFMRLASIDELPQFFNILLGDMSLVGTRPPTLDEFELYKTHHMSRLAMKPGLTGMWQISGRSKITDFEEVVKLDNEYIRNFSLPLDIKIICKTFFTVLSRKGSQ